MGERTWRAFLARGDDAEKPLASRRVASDFAIALSRLAARDDTTAFNAVWEAVSGEALEAVAAAKGASLEPLGKALRAFVRAKEEAVRVKTVELAASCVQRALEGVKQGDEAREERLRFVVDVAEVVKGDAQVAQVRPSLSFHPQDSWNRC